MDQWK